MVQSLQVVLVVRELRESPFLEHLVSQPVQEVLGVPHHLIFKTKEKQISVREDGLNRSKLHISVVVSVLQYL